jgi:hypothetical protein
MFRNIARKRHDLNSLCYSNNRKNYLETLIKLDIEDVTQSKEYMEINLVHGSNCDSVGKILKEHYEELTPQEGSNLPKSLHTLYDHFDKNVKYNGPFLTLEQDGGIIRPVFK